MRSASSVRVDAAGDREVLQVRDRLGDGKLLVPFAETGKRAIAPRPGEAFGDLPGTCRAGAERVEDLVVTPGGVREQFVDPAIEVGERLAVRRQARRPAPRPRTFSSEAT